MPTAAPPPGAKQRCAYLLEPGRIEIREVPIPTPGIGEVVLRIDCALVGGTDRKAFARGHPQIPMPGPFGHRYSGTVAAVGPGGPAFVPGHKVMGVHSAPCLTCDLCRRRREHLCHRVMQDKVLGAFAQYLRVPAAVARQNLYHRPEKLSSRHAAMLEPVACVVHGLNVIDWRGVDRVLIVGLGVMGLLFTQLVPFYSLAQCEAVSRRQPPLGLARRFGVKTAWDVSKQPLSEQLDPSQRYDCVIECTGKLDGWQQAFDRTAPGGQVLLFGGLPRGTTFPVDSYRLHYEEVRVLGSFHFAPREVCQAREFILSKKLELEPLISGRLPLEQLPIAMELLEKGEGLQYAIDPRT